MWQTLCAKWRRAVYCGFAPGKRNDKDHKITDMLLMCYQLASHQLRFEDVFAIIRARFEEIHQGRGSNRRWARCWMISRVKFAAVPARLLR